MVLILQINFYHRSKEHFIPINVLMSLLLCNPNHQYDFFVYGVVMA